MTQDDKDLLLLDLCARLPYKTKIQLTEYSDLTGEKLPSKIKTLDYCMLGKAQAYCKGFRKDEIKPYLFPLSSITEEQKKEYYSLADDVTIKPGQGTCLGIKIHCIKLGISDNPHEEVWDYINLYALDWLNKNHFDYKGLINKGLAIDATNLGIYK